MRFRNGFIALFAGSLILLASTPVATAAALAVPTCGGLEATHVGTDANNVIEGTPGRDVIVAKGGDDIVRGGGGNDVICGGSGNDELFGGPGKDRIFGQGGNDTISGGRGADKAYGGTSRDRILGKSGNDLLKGQGGNDVLKGGAGSDRIFGGNGQDRLRGNAGIDVLNGGPARDNCIGESEYNCEIVRTGDRIFVLGGGPQQQFPAGVAFHIAHGFNCVPDPGEVCSLADQESLSFQLFVDGVNVTANGVEVALAGSRWLQSEWVFNFPSGMTGTHTFKGVWSDGVRVPVEETTTVTFG